jgi:hypothetical protein
MQENTVPIHNLITILADFLEGIVGIKSEEIIKFGVLVLMFKLLNIIYAAFTKQIGSKILDWITDHTQKSFSQATNFTDFVLTNYAKYDSLIPNDDAVSYNPLELIYSVRLELAKKHMIDYEVDDFLDPKSVKPDYVNKDKTIIDNLKSKGKKLILNSEKGFDIQESTALKRFNSIFDKQNFGLITSGLVKGKIAYVVMIAIGASIGTVYHKDVYLKCIETISQALQENQLKLEKSDEELAESIIELTSKLMPNVELEFKYFVELKKFNTSYNPNLTQKIESKSRNTIRRKNFIKCNFQKLKFDKIDFDNLVEECYSQVRDTLTILENSSL